MIAAIIVSLLQVGLWIIYCITIAATNSTTGKRFMLSVVSALLAVANAIATIQGFGWHYAIFAAAWALLGIYAWLKKT